MLLLTNTELYQSRRAAEGLLQPYCESLDFDGVEARKGWRQAESERLKRGQLSLVHELGAVVAAIMMLHSYHKLELGVKTQHSVPLTKPESNSSCVTLIQGA